MFSLINLLRRLNARANILAPTHYVSKLDKNDKLLDVGCGNNSPQRYKNINKNIFYYGIDVTEHNQNPGVISKYADSMVYSESSVFHEAINKTESDFSMVISSHNIEHCEEPNLVIDSMCNCLKSNGILYISFPCEESINFPSRLGTLNFYDDPTHIHMPIFKEILSRIIKNNLRILIKQKRRRFFPLAILGFFRERLSNKKRKVYRGTWDYWGFESVIVAKKN
jgi:SAM-dependent methyltransferase